MNIHTPINMNTNKIHPFIEEAIKQVKSLGYLCFYPNYKTNLYGEILYCYITDGTRISHLTINHWKSALNLITTHKPSSNCGTGFSIRNDKGSYDLYAEDLTDELIRTSFGNYSNGFGSAYTIQKYKDWEDFKNNSLTGKLCKKDFIKL